MRSNKLPPLSAIHVFEAAARHTNFTRAASELGMTQAAVSYQIKVLEDRVGAKLFVRQSRGVVLSDIGIRLLPRVSEAFDLLGDAFSDIKQRHQDTLTISVVPSFAVSMLAPRLGKFQVSNPDISVRILMSETISDFNRSDIDVGIRSGRGDWPGLQCDKLIPAKFTPMLSPDLMKNHGALNTPEDLKSYPLIDPVDPWWDKWFQAAGVSDKGSASGPGGSMGSQVMEATAAIAGQGVAILTPAFYFEAVQNKQLVQPFDIVCEDNWAYWLVCPQSRRNSTPIRAFRNWLVSETAKFRQ